MFCRADLAKPASTLYMHNLTGVLETAIRATNAQYADPEIIERLDCRLLEVCQVVRHVVCCTLERSKCDSLVQCSHRGSVAQMADHSDGRPLDVFLISPEALKVFSGQVLQFCIFHCIKFFI